MKVLHIPAGLMQEMVSHCRRELPNEGCGLLAGQNGRVEMVLPMLNISPDPGRNYLVDCTEQKRAFARISEAGWELVGIFHSHPNGMAIPSQSDIRQAYYPEAGYVIIGLGGVRPDIRAYHMRRDKGTCVRVHLDILRSKKSRRLGKIFGPVVSSYWGGTR